MSIFRLPLLTLLFLGSANSLAVSKDTANFGLSIPSIETLGVLGADVGVNVFVKNLGTKFSESAEAQNILYTSTNMSKWVFVQANMSIGDKAEGEITTLADRKSFFSVKKGETGYFILAQGLQRDEVLKLKKTVMTGVTTPAKKSALNYNVDLKNFNFINFLLASKEAVAEAKCLSGTDIRRKLSVNTEEEFKVLKTAASCANGGGLGVWDATVGAYKFGVDVVVKGTEQITCGVASVVKQGWKRCDEYADARAKTVDATMNALGDMKQYAGKAIDGFSGLPGEVQAQILCEMGSSVATGAAVTFATVGAGAPAALGKMSEVLKKVSEMPGMKKNSTTLKSMAVKMEQKAKDKDALIEAAKPMPTEFRAKLEIVEYLKKVASAKAGKVDELAKKLETSRTKIFENANVTHANTILWNRTADIKGAYIYGEYNAGTFKSALKALLRYGDLTDEERAIATKLAQSNKTGRVEIDFDNPSEEGKFVTMLRNRLMAEGREKVELNPKAQLASTEKFNKMRLEEKRLREELYDAETELKEALNKLQKEIPEGMPSIALSQKLSQKQKDAYAGFATPYGAAVFCGTASSVRSAGSQNDESKSTR